MDRDDDTPRPSAGQVSGGFDQEALREKRARALAERLFLGTTREVGEGSDGWPRIAHLPPLMVAESRPGEFQEFTNRVARHPLHGARHAALTNRGYDVDFSAGERAALLHRAADRSGVRSRTLIEGSLAALRTALNEAATESVIGTPWGTKPAEAESLDEVETSLHSVDREQARREAAMWVEEVWDRAGLSDLQAEALRLRYVEDLPRRKIAARLYDDYDPDDPEATRRALGRVDNLLGVARRKLREAAAVG